MLQQNKNTTIKSEISGNTEIEEKPILKTPKILGKIDLSQFEKKKKTYIIDTNVFVECPDIIQQISKNDLISVSKKTPHF